MTLGERITDFYYWNYVEPHVRTCILKTVKDGFRPMPLTEEKKFYNVPSFRITMAMPRLSMRIILRIAQSWKYNEFNATLFEYIMGALYILEGLRVWCCHRGEDIPPIGTDRRELMALWLDWGVQRGYIHEDYLV